IRSMVAEKLSTAQPLDQSALRAILMSSSARYSALTIRIPDLSGTTWSYAGDTLRFYSNGSK
ncbi:Uncharacterized protein FKW44_020553, partial [Caligus rogercresseyi]